MNLHNSGHHNNSIIAGMLLTAMTVFFSIPANTFAGSYMFADESAPNTIAHPTNYTGSGGSITVTVGIDPSSANASDMVIPVKNIITTMNRLQATTENLISGGNNNIPSGSIDL